ncbi:hypothetical protein F4678DRAFT_453614 [Xylaria arbuscula]|nr:hypothetical protein F4678DRAFT_453614 [Xylaria arbuscula]
MRMPPAINQFLSRWLRRISLELFAQLALGAESAPAPKCRCMFVFSNGSSRQPESQPIQVSHTFFSAVSTISISSFLSPRQF